MMNSIDFFNTNDKGQEYMTMLGCSANDLPVVISIGVLCGLVVVQYLDVALHNYKISKKYTKSNTKKYLLYFTLVFVFCAIAGYGYRLMSIWYNPYKILAIILLILNLLTFNFRRYMRRTNAITTIFEAESQMLTKIDSFKSILENKVLKSFESDEIEMITYNDLKQLEEGKKYQVNNKVYFIPIDLKKDVLHFVTMVEPNGWFGMQVHDCYEMCEVFKGEFVRNKADDNAYLVGQRVYYGVNETHNPGSKTGCGINVYFSNKKFKK